MEMNLGDIASFINGYAFKPNDWGELGLPIIRIQNLTGNAYSENHYAGVIEDKYVVNHGDILISWSASLGIYKWCGNKAVLNQHIFKVAFDKEVVDKDYFFYQVESILKKAGKDTHGATMKHLTRPIFNKLVYKQVNIDDQRKIGAVLKKINSIVTTRKWQIEQLDVLIKSRFVEMFGNPIHNDKEWEYKKLSEVTDIVLGTTPKSSEPLYWDGDLKWITPAEIDDTSFEIFDTIRHITEAGVSSAGLKSFPPGTVIFSTRAPIGKTAIAGCKMYCNQGFKNFICSPQINSVYLFSVLKFYKNYFIHLGTGTTFKELSKAKIEKVSIAVPPIEVQEQYELFFRETYKLKSAVQKSLNETQLLFDSLMQEYFG